MVEGLPTWRGQSQSRAMTIAIGAAVGRHARGGDLIALIGELGAGKTQFVRGLADGLGLEGSAVASPTFVMVQEYLSTAARASDAAPHPGAAFAASGGRLIHIDAYRIHKLEELESIGWEIATDTLGGEMRANAVVAIEWADRLDDLVGGDRLEVRLWHEGDDCRGVTISAQGLWSDRAAALFAELEGVAATTHAGDAVSPDGRTDAKPQAARATACPICGKPVVSHEPAFPFCSKRCKLIDLGKWLGGQYTISRPVEQSDLEQE